MGDPDRLYITGNTNDNSDAAFYSQYGPVNEGGEIKYSINIGGRYGDMPNDYLAAKFESTDDQDQAEYAYEEFGRRQLVDRRPDPATFAYEEPRQGAGVRSGILNLHHTGTRSGATPRHPEAFLDDTWGDPRGIATDPDFKQLRRQEQARMRFVRMSADADHSITGGGVAEEQNIARLNQIKREVAPRYKIFSTSRDGKRNGMSRVFTHESSIKKTERPSQSYGDTILDAALTPQRHTTILSNIDIRRSKAYHQFTTDHEFAVAKYGADGRTRKLSMDVKPLEYTDTDSELSESAKTEMYRGLVASLSEAVKQKSQGQHDTDHAAETMTQAARRAAAIAKDLSRLLYAAQSTTAFASSDTTMCMKSPGTPKQAQSGVMTTVQDGSEPVVQTLNSQIIRRGVKKCEDPLITKDYVLTDDRKPELAETKLVALKSGPQGTEFKMQSIDFDQDQAIPLMTKVYRTVHGTPAFSSNGVEISQEFTDQDLTHIKKSTGPSDRGPRVDDAETMSEFRDNGVKERRLAPLGNKYIARKYNTRDAGLSEGSMAE